MDMNRLSQRLLFFLLVFLPFFLLYKMTANQIFSFDAVSNAIVCENDLIPSWFHSNHLLYPFLGALWFKIERFFGYEGYAVYSLARFNSLLCAAALGLLFIALMNRIGKILSILVVALLGTSYATWHYAVDGRAIGASVFFNVLTIVYLLYLFERQNAPWWKIIPLIIFSTLYVLSHAMGLFHIAAVSAGLWIRTRHKKETPKYKWPWMYGAGTLATIGLAYLLIYFLITPQASLKSFLSWAIGYAAYGGVHQVTMSPYWVQAGKQLLLGLWQGWTNAFLYSSGGAGASFFSNFIGLGILGMMAFAFISFFRNRSPHKILVGILWGWGGLNLLFMSFWSPGQEGFRLHVIFPWMVATAFSLARLKGFPWAVGTLGSVVFLFNFTGPIYHASFIQNNTGYQLLRQIETQLKPGDYFICGTGEVVPNIEVLRPYFFAQINGGPLAGRLYAARERSLAPLSRRLQEKERAGHRLFLADDLLDPKTQQSIEGRFQLERGAILQFLRLYELKPVFNLTNHHVVLRARRKK
ncbi:MAG: hypothetical protein LHV69_06425 [Elusimicrobia bacterium]|nr:hypothetical protein [Candidatus Obscuribacterium magneticum]